MPSVLIEIGFITNKQEEEYLNSENGQNEVVNNIMDALRKYKDELESSSKTIIPATTTPVPSPR
jgi:N-acetylmuramoyl-L-alanine amidase